LDLVCQDRKTFCSITTRMAGIYPFKRSNHAAGYKKHACAWAW